VEGLPRTLYNSRGKLEQAKGIVLGDTIRSEDNVVSREQIDKARRVICGYPGMTAEHALIVMEACGILPSQVGDKPQRKNISMSIAPDRLI
jgi:hypothetical protein